MAGYILKQKINEFLESGINFKDNLYVPEVIGQGPAIHEREDHNHILKRIGSCTRASSIPNVNLEYFDEALNDPDSGLTFTALTGMFIEL